MSTQLEDHGTHYTVSTIQKIGKSRRMPRGHVRVGKSDPEALEAELKRQMTLARERAGVTVK